MRTSIIFKIAVITLLGAIVSGCVSPKVTRRYSKAEFPAAPSTGQVGLSVFSTDVPPATTQTTILNLSERAQASLIKELSLKAKDADSLIKSLASPIAKQKPQQRVVDRTVVERRLILSLENRSSQPSSRIHRAVVVITLGQDASFKSWSQFATRYQTVNLGSVTFTQGSEVGLGVKATPPQIRELAEVTGSAKAVQNLVETLNLQQRFVEASGALGPKEARLIQDGAFGIDLTGNIVLDLTLEVGQPTDRITTDVFLFSNLFDEAGKPRLPEAIGIDRQTVAFLKPSSCRPVFATAQLDSILRSVSQKDGANTLIEGDDKAVYQPVTATVPNVMLVPAEALRFSVWFLVDAGNRPVHIQRVTGGANAEVLQFASFDEANSFLQYWLESNLAPATQLTVKGRPLLLNNQPLLKQDLGLLQAEQQKLNWANSQCSF